MEIKRNFDLLDRFALLPDTIGKFKLAGKESGKWREYDTKEYSSIVMKLSMGLLASGFISGDKIATITNNRPEWNFMEMGAAQVGMVHVPIHPTLTNDEFVYILNHSEAKLLIVSDKTLYARIKDVSDQLLHLRQILTFNQVDGANHWSLLTSAGEQEGEKYFDQVQKIKEAVSENDLLTIIYTSGTTGDPKGVMLSHRNLMSNAITTSIVQHLNHNHKALSFLPLSHVFEHMVNYQYHYLGISIYYAENLTTIGRDIKDLEVDGFIAVPRLLESIYDKIISKARTLSPLKKGIFFWALGLAQQFEPYQDQSPWYKFKLAIADKLVFSKWRAALSPNITFIGCGGSACSLGWPVFSGRPNYRCTKDTG
jgi:long-chain acyl-CoA synthetase